MWERWTRKTLRIDTCFELAHRDVHEVRAATMVDRDVVDDGVGSSAKGTGKGLELVRQRLHAIYGPAASIGIVHDGGLLGDGRDPERT